MSSPLARPAYLHAPGVASHARRTTFAEQAPPHHHHGHHHDRVTAMGVSSRQATLRARNGTITSPMPHYSQLHPHTHTPSHMSTHMESDTTPQSFPNNGTDLRSPPAAHANHHSHPHPYSHVPHPTHIHANYPYAPRPRAHTGQGGLPSPFELAARFVTHVPAVKRFVGEHEKEVVKETDGPRRRGSVYTRMDSKTDGLGEEVADEVSLEEEDLEKMGGDEVRFLFFWVANWRLTAIG